MEDDNLSACATRVASLSSIAAPPTGANAKAAILNLDSLQSKLKALQARPTLDSIGLGEPLTRIDSVGVDEFLATSDDEVTESTINIDSEPEITSPASEDETEEELLKLARAGDADGAVQFVEAAASAGRLNGRMVNMAVSAMLTNQRHPDGIASWMFTVCKRAEVPPTVACFNNLLGAYLKEGPAAAVLAWVARMRAHGIVLDVVVCNHILSAYARHGDLAAVEALLARMLAPDSDVPSPDVVSFNIAISACAATQPERSSALLLQMLDVGLAASIASWSAVVHAWAKAAKPTEAQAWLDRMLSAGVRPDSAIFNSVLAAFSAAADPAGARRVLRRMSDFARDDCPAAAPDLISYNTLISACARAARPAEAEQALAELRAAELTPDRVTYSSVVLAHAKVGDAKAAQRTFDEMVAQGLRADAVAFNALLSSHAKHGDAAAVRASCAAMEAAGVSMTPTSQAIVINSLVQGGEVEAAEQALLALVRRAAGRAASEVTAATFNAVVSGFGKRGQPQRAALVVRHMEASGVQPTLITFNALAAAWASDGDLPATEAALARATAAGLRLDRYSYGALLQACTRAASSLRGARGGAAVAAVRSRAVGHAYAMLRSGVPLNAYLRAEAARALGGERAFAQMCEQHRATQPEQPSPMQLRPSSSPPPPPRPKQQQQPQQPRQLRQLQQQWRREQPPTPRATEGAGAWETVARRQGPRRVAAGAA